MSAGKVRVTELILLDGIRHARISCPADLIPAPGRYLLAGDGSDAPLPVPLFCTDSAPGGFIAAPAPDSWMPGMELYVRGPLGRGFSVPPSARRVCLTAFGDSFSRLRGLIQPVLKQGANLVVVADFLVEGLPDEAEVQPLSSLGEVVVWADYAAFDVTREALADLVKKLRKLNQASTLKEAEVLIRTPLPCGGVADCGACAVVTKSGWKMACKDGPVFDLLEI
jgi:dihydroorotate dehydrogenase electron transfer subunit